jgi:hypothetical protein
MFVKNSALVVPIPLLTYLWHAVFCYVALQLKMIRNWGQHMKCFELVNALNDFPYMNR